jgi:hypothetical protein
LYTWIDVEQGLQHSLGSCQRKDGTWQG